MGRADKRRRARCKTGAVSRAELPQVMVGVQVRKPEPFSLRHGPKMRVKRQLKVSRLPGEFFNPLAQDLEIFLKLGGRGAIRFLIQFAHRRETVGPGHGSPERNPSHDRAGILRFDWSGRPLPHVKLKSVAQVANHLVGRHFTPFSLATGVDGLESAKDLLFVLRVAKTLHDLSILGGPGILRAKPFGWLQASLR
jgi:hypothetical protein